jgi:DNA repair exonuclease SbcCD ATPase subunit
MMAATLPGFQLASEIGPSPSEREAFETLLQSQASQLEEFREVGPRQAAGPDLVTLQKIGELLQSNKELQATVENLGKKIEGLENVNNRLERQISDVKGLAKDRIGELLAEIVDIRNGQIVDRKYVNDLTEELGEVQDLINQHAEAINKIHQATKRVQAPTGKKSKARVEQLKEILRCGSKTYKELERLLDISPKEMNRLVAMLDTGDNRQKVLRLRAWNSLTSNVKCFAEEDSKVVELLKI